MANSVFNVVKNPIYSLQDVKVGSFTSTEESWYFFSLFKN